MVILMRRTGHGYAAARSSPVEMSKRELEEMQTRPSQPRKLIKRRMNDMMQPGASRVQEGSVIGARISVQNLEVTGTEQERNGEGTTRHQQSPTTHDYYNF